MIDLSIVNKDTPHFDNDVVISIQSIHAERIYSGKKTFELRKVIPSRTPQRIFLYETNGKSKISGHIVVNRILSSSPEILWKNTGPSAAVRKRFFDYFEGRNLAYAIEISSVVKYKNPITSAQIAAIEPGFRPSQNFLYLDNLPSLQKALFEHAYTECLAATSTNNNHGISLSPFEKDSSGRFVQLVDCHITDSYLETGPDYAKKIIELNSLDEDTEGIFTLRKRILEVNHKGSRIGFVTLTEKLGGSVKTGPTILEQEFRGQDLGKYLRATLHGFLSDLGYRKVYCTAPMKNSAAINYLVSSGYRIEAHLSKHYHQGHDELVFGYIFSDSRGQHSEVTRPIEPITQMNRLTASSLEVIDFISDEFSSMYCPIDLPWAYRQVKEAVAYAKGRGDAFKPRAIYIGKGLRLLSVCLCVHKRGGGTKLVLLSKTAHQKSLSKFIDYISSSIMASRNLKSRKLYSHVPIYESVLIQAYYDCGFKSEGILDRPYNQISDMIVLSKEL